MSEQPKLVNLTTHDVRIYSRDHRTLRRVYEQSGELARIFVTDTPRGSVDGVELASKHLGECKLIYAGTGATVGDGLILERPGTLYIVSLFVLQHLPRRDFIAPDTTARGAVRDAEGYLLGATRFIGAG